MLFFFLAGTENRENTENTENRILNHSSDLKLENQSCLTKKGMTRDNRFVLLFI